MATPADPLSRQESFTYDLNGNLVSWTDRKRQTTTFRHDATALSRRERERSEARCASSRGWGPASTKEARQTFIGYGTTGTPPTYASTISTTYDAGNRATQVVDSGAGTITGL